MFEPPAREFGLWLLSHLLTPCARGSPDLLTGCIQCGGERSRSKPMALWLGRGSAALPRAHRHPWHGDPLHHPHTHVHTQMLVQVSTRLWLCGQIWRSSSWREKRMSKQKQQADHQPCYCSVLKQHRLRSANWHTVSETAN